MRAIMKPTATTRRLLPQFFAVALRRGEMKARTKQLKLKTAWVVTWVGSNTHKLTPVANLDHRKNARTVAAAVELLYAAEYYNGQEMLRYAKSPKDTPYRAKISVSQRVTCGHNPLLLARKVTNLKVEPTGKITWTEPPPEAELLRKLGSCDAS